MAGSSFLFSQSKLCCSTFTPTFLGCITAQMCSASQQWKFSWPTGSLGLTKVGSLQSSIRTVTTLLGEVLCYLFPVVFEVRLLKRGPKMNSENISLSPVALELRSFVPESESVSKNGFCFSHSDQTKV